MRKSRRRHLTVRDRILAAVVLMAALALITSGATAWGLQRVRVDSAIDAALDQSIAEMRTLAATGVDPETGEPFQDSDRLLYAMMGRKVPATDEGMIALVGDTVRYRTQGTGLPIHEDTELIAAVTGTWREDHTRIHSLRTSRAEYRVATMPVEVGDSTPGALVLAYDRDRAQAAVTATFRTYGLVAGGSLVILTVVAWLLAGRLLRPLRTLRETANQITDTDLARRITVEGHDDIADLARTFNAMLSRLEASFSSQRQLLDDAGHELRTPITIVRGHLELMDPTDPVDAGATRELALSELDRMHRLADDLLLLAKSETPGFVRAVPAEVGTLLDNALDQARRLGPRRWRIGDRVETTVTLDPQRITQALLQLAANAVKFSEEGTTITLGSHLSPGTLELWVQDEGVGIAEDQQQLIFDRFTRGTEATGPAREGAGLGLSIVAAIAAGHGGDVEVDSAVGLGARFTLRIPATDVRLDEPRETEVIVEADTLPLETTGWSAGHGSTEGAP